MKQKTSQLAGTGKVFSFTFTQFFKNKGNMISMIILLLLSLASVPVMTLIGGGSTKKADMSDIRNVYLINDTEFPISGGLIEAVKADNPYFTDTEFLTGDFNVSEYEAKLDVYDVCVNFTYESSPEAMTGSYLIHLYILPDSSLSDGDLEELQTLLSGLFDSARLQALSVSEEQLTILLSDWETDSEKLSDYLNPEDEGKWSTQYFVQFAYAIVVMFVSIFCVSYIVRAIVEEKSSKLVELLMVSVKPLALIVGKILAALAYVGVLFVMLIGGYLLSYYVSGLFLDVSATGNVFTQMGLSTELLNTSPLLILIILISLLFGLLTFAIIAGLSATGCSTTEDTQSATGAATFLIMFGYLASVFSSSADIPVLNHIASLCPIISAYSAPVHYVMGNISLGVFLLSWLIQMIVILLLALFCSRIYVNLLMYRGSRVKFSQMLSMARQPRAGKEEN